MGETAKNVFDDIEASSLIEKWVDGVILGDLTGKIITVNEAEEKISGYSRQELSGKSAIFTLIDKKDIPKALVLFKDILIQGYVKNEEIIGLRKNGTKVYVNFSSAVIRNKGGLPKYIIVVVRDITEKKKLEDKVSELNEILRLLNKILRHDILNDLSVASGNIDTYFDYGNEKMNMDQVLKEIREATQRSISFIGKMKELESAVSSGKGLDRVDVRQVLEEVKKEQIGLAIKVEGDGVIIADQAFHSVLDNLIKNAKIHGGAKQVDVRIEEKDEFVQIRIIDDGKGIPNQIKNKLFVEGFKYGETGHTGLGLYIVKKTIERYGGKVWVEDNQPQGTVFVLEAKKAAR